MESLDRDTVIKLIKKADSMRLDNDKKSAIIPFLEGKIVANLFFEPSTRTRNSFEIAAKRFNAIVLSPNMSSSSTTKGESLIDTVHTFEALGTSLFIIRHSDNNTAQFIASELTGNASVINAGDGTNQHPTQTLADLMTIRQHKSEFESLIVTIVGDIMHSRVARSAIIGLKIMGVNTIRLIAPDELIPRDVDHLAVDVYDNFDQGLKDADVVMTLRMQTERFPSSDIPDLDKFSLNFCLTEERLANAKPDAIVMHPGPINRGVEIASKVADGPQSVILQQVSNGVAVRMAVIDSLF